MSYEGCSSQVKPLVELVYEFGLDKIKRNALANQAELEKLGDIERTILNGDYAELNETVESYITFFKEKLLPVAQSKYTRVTGAPSLRLESSSIRSCPDAAEQDSSYKAQANNIPAPKNMQQSVGEGKKAKMTSRPFRNPPLNNSDNAQGKHPRGARAFEYIGRKLKSDVRSFFPGANGFEINGGAFSNAGRDANNPVFDVTMNIFLPDPCGNPQHDEHPVRICPTERARGLDFCDTQ